MSEEMDSTLLTTTGVKSQLAQLLRVPVSNPSMDMPASTSASLKPLQAQQQTPPLAKPDQDHLCAGCNLKIVERYLLRAIDKNWHEDCLRCNCCGGRLGEMGQSLYFKQGMLLCKDDYLRMYGARGECAACRKAIPAFEMVMRARNNVYHLECFACQECNHRFCVGDKFYLCDNKILCEYDYEERVAFARLACNHSGLAQLKRHFQSTDLEEVDEPPKHRYKPMNQDLQMNSVATR